MQGSVIRLYTILPTTGREETRREASSDVRHVEREEIFGPLRRAKGQEDLGETGRASMKVRVDQAIRTTSEENVGPPCSLES